MINFNDKMKLELWREIISAAKEVKRLGGGSIRFTIELPPEDPDINMEIEIDDHFDEVDYNPFIGGYDYDSIEGC